MVFSEESVDHAGPDEEPIPAARRDTTAAEEGAILFYRGGGHRKLGLRSVKNSRERTLGWLGAPITGYLVSCDLPVL